MSGQTAFAALDALAHEVLLSAFAPLVVLAAVVAVLAARFLSSIRLQYWLLSLANKIPIP